MTRRKFLATFQERKLGGVDALVIPGIVAIPRVEEYGPDSAEAAEDHKGPTPGNQRECSDHKRRSECPAPACERPHDALRPDPLDFRQPCRKSLREVGEAPGFASAEEEPSNIHAVEVPHEASGRGKCRPPDDDSHQDLARSHPIAHPAAGYFKQRVGDGEGREDIAHLALRQSEVTGDNGRRLRDTDAIDIGKHGQSYRKNHNPVTGFRWFCEVALAGGDMDG